MTETMLMLLVELLALGRAAWVVGSKRVTFTGTVSDSQCGMKHTSPSRAAAHCVESTASDGAKYVLVPGGKVYQLTPQEKFKGLGGRCVKITGKMQGDTIAASTVETAQP